MLLDDKITKEVYDTKYNELMRKIGRIVPDAKNRYKNLNKKIG